VSEPATAWPEVPLGEICEFKYGRSLPGPLRAAGPVPVYGSNGIVGAHNEAITTGPAIVIGRKGSFGEVAFSPSPCWPIDTTYYIDRTATKADLRWLAYRLSALGLTGLNRAAAIPGLNREDAYRQRLLLPSLPEQQRIAEILDQGEALRAKRRVALAQLDTLTQSIFLDMFGDPATNPKAWPRREIGELGKVATGGTPPSAKLGMFDGPIPFITPGDLESRAPARRSVTAAGAAEGVTVRPGATFVCCIGATIGKIGMATMRSAFNQQINAVEWGEAVDDTYGYWVLRFFKPTIIAWAASTTLPILKKSTFERLEVPVPPVDLQRMFSRRLSAIHRLDSSNSASLAMFEELFATLQFRAFRGELYS
jgi:type I restriction enzyme S subunit